MSPFDLLELYYNIFSTSCPHSHDSIYRPLVNRVHIFMPFWYPSSNGLRAGQGDGKMFPWHNTYCQVRPSASFCCSGITLRGNENELARKIISQVSSMVLIRISISCRTGWLSITQLWIITLSKSYVVICNTTWQEGEFTTKHFYNKSTIKRKQLKGL